jgi:DNA-binding GntR family transcriptional regulator
MQGAMAPRQTERVPRTASIVPLVRHEIERLIGCGALVGGARINESALALRLGISRGPIREACRELANTGLLQAELNRGFFVHEVNTKQALDIYDLRASLFGMAGRLAARVIDARQLSALAAQVEAMTQAMAAQDLATYYPLNVAFHQSLIEAADNYKLAQLWPLLEAELHLFRRRGLVQGGSMETSNEEHRALLEALRAGDDALAGRLAERHILAGKGRFLRSLD